MLYDEQNYGITMSQNYNQVLKVTPYTGDKLFSIDVMFINQLVEDTYYKMYLRPNFSSVYKINDFAILNNIPEIVNNTVTLNNFSFKLSSQQNNQNVEINFGDDDSFDAQQIKFEITDNKKYVNDTDWIFEANIPKELIDENSNNKLNFSLSAITPTSSGSNTSHSTEGVIEINLSKDTPQIINDSRDKISNINLQNSVFIYMNYNSDSKQIDWYDSSIINSYDINYVEYSDYYTQPIKDLFKIQKQSIISNKSANNSVASFSNTSGFKAQAEIDELKNNNFSTKLPEITGNIILPSDVVKDRYDDVALDVKVEELSDNLINVKLNNKTKYNSISQKVENNLQSSGFVLNPLTLGQTQLNFSLNLDNSLLDLNINIDQITDSETAYFLNQNTTIMPDNNYLNLGYFNFEYNDISQLIQNEDWTFTYFEDIARKYWHE